MTAKTNTRKWDIITTEDVKKKRQFNVCLGYLKCFETQLQKDF